MVNIHRYLGISVAFFLIIAGVTGSVIAFYDPLERVFNTHLRVVAPQESARTARDMLVIRQALEEQDPRSHVYALQFPQQPDESVFSRVIGAIDPATGQPFQLDYDEVFANPYTGERLGVRSVGGFSLRPENLIAQIYYLHYSLVLPMNIGIWLMGSVSLLWALECLAGFYLTLPPAKKKDRVGAKSKSYFSRWKPSWQIKAGLGTNRLIHDAHRASGLWLYPLFFIFAITGFALNLAGPYGQIVSKFSNYVHFQEMPIRPPLKEALVNPPIDWFEALDLGQRYFTEQAKVENFTVEKPAALEYRRDLGMYFYVAHTSRDLRDAGGSPTETNSPATAAVIAIDARDGRFLGLQLPTGQRAANTVTNWLLAMHTTAIWGLPWQIAVSVIGVAVMALSVTGLVLWWRRRSFRAPQVRQASSRGEPVNRKSLRQS